MPQQLFLYQSPTELSLFFSLSFVSFHHILMTQKMSSSTYCHDPKNLAEARVLRLKLAPTNSSSSIDKNVHIGSSTGGWTFLQSLDMKNPKQANITENKDTIYIPPTCKSPSSGLSEESLEMCTERLGSESGNDGGFEEQFALLSAEIVQLVVRPTERHAEKETCTYKFPPPLTSISGGQNVHVKPHREDGRLVLEAVSVSTPCRFQAERIGGRLRIHLMINDSINTEAEEEVDDMTENVESTEMEKLGRKGGRCKEGGESSCCFFNSETFWVATS